MDYLTEMRHLSGIPKPRPEWDLKEGVWKGKWQGWTWGDFEKVLKAADKPITKSMGSDFEASGKDKTTLEFYFGKGSDKAVAKLKKAGYKASQVRPGSHWIGVSAKHMPKENSTKPRTVS